MEIIVGLFTNYSFVVSIVCWTVAQTLKVILTFIKTKEFDKERFWGAGGMPSSHTALVVGLAISLAREYGVGSPYFTLAFVLAGVVMYDATGIRRAAGEHAKALNNLLFNSQKNNVDEEAEGNEEYKELKEFLGHTPIQVCAGALLGIIIPMMIPIF